jgi:hypothetical protein
MSKLAIVLLLAAALTGCAQSDDPITGGTGGGGNGNGNGNGGGSEPPLICTTATETSPSLGATFNMHFGGTSSIASEQLTLSFTSVVQDTRCPTGVSCPSAGRADVVVNIRDATHNPADLALSTASPVGTYRGRYDVTLVSVIPYPEDGHAATPEADYCVELQVTRH